MDDRFGLFEKKIEEYYLSCIPAVGAMTDKSVLSQWPFYKFSVVRLLGALAARIKDDEVLRAVGDKLLDIKLHYAYLLTVLEHFHRGATLIVGNNEIEKLNPRTISLLRAIHYRVYLLSVLTEQVLDLLHLLLTEKPSNFKRGKWDKVISLVQEATGGAIISPDDAERLTEFKAQYRTAEMHKFSMVRGLIAKTQWTHLQNEEQAIANIISNMFKYYVLH